MMDIAYFKYEMLSCLENFESWWTSQTSVDSVSYPIFMSEEEWLIRFANWLNNQ